jgi:hypothetical protein
VKQELSIGRRIARAIFVGMGTVFLLLAATLFAADPDARRLILKHDFGSEAFQSMAQTGGVLLLLGPLFFAAALFIRRSGLLALSACLAINLLALIALWPVVLLLLPLLACLLCLLSEGAVFFERVARHSA